MAKGETKTYDVICQRQGNWYKLERVTDFQTALGMAKDAIGNKKNEEVRIVESIYDKATSKEKTAVAKIFTQNDTSANDADAKEAEKAAAKYRADQRKKKAQSIDRQIKNLSIMAVLIIIAIVAGGLFYQWLISYWSAQQ